MQQYSANQRTLGSSQAFADANRGRDFSIYARAMDAAELVKANEIFPHLKVPEGGTILDLGSGTAALAERAAAHFSRARVVAQDLSHELLEIADHRRALVSLLYGNALDQKLPDTSLDAAYCSSCGHEVESFSGRGSMARVLGVVFRELKPGGVFVVRDFIKPALRGEISLDLHESELVALEKTTLALSSEGLNYSALTPAQLFFRFAHEFGGGGAFSYRIEKWEGRELITLAAEWAYEFLMRKDYVANWRNEIREKYCYWNADEAVSAFEAAGFSEVKIIPHRNSWILTNRIEGRVELFSKSGSVALNPLPFFDTHMTVVGRKTEVSHHSAVVSSIPLVDYDRTLGEIVVDFDAGVLLVKDRSFSIDRSRPMVRGSKREVYYLKRNSGEDLVVKIPRIDGINAHNCFKAMQQTIERSDVLRAAHVPHLKVVDYDRSGPPYRYLVQEALPAHAICAAELIRDGQLAEIDVAQMAEIVNRFESEKLWQLDTNPYNWYRVKDSDDRSQMVYADGKVYRYDERWSFGRVGLLQWLDPAYVSNAVANCPAVPLAAVANNPVEWWDPRSMVCQWWKRYLNSSLLPVEEF